jgi:hypothetical protein
MEVAEQLGHSPEICLRDYAGTFAEYAPKHRQDAVQTVNEASERPEAS